MPSTFTQNNGIEKPGINEQVGTWGYTLNSDMDRLDAAIEGSVVIDISGLSSYNLVIPQGAGAGNGRYKVITFTGAPTVTNPFPVTVTPNSAQKMYYIHASGNFSVSVSQGTGRSYLVRSYSTGALWCDGSGSGANVDGFFSPVGPIDLPINLQFQIETLFCDQGLQGHGNSGFAPTFTNTGNPGSVRFGNGSDAYVLQLGSSPLTKIACPDSVNPNVRMNAAAEIELHPNTKVCLGDGTNPVSIAAGTGATPPGQLYLSAGLTGAPNVQLRANSGGVAIIAADATQGVQIGALPSPPTSTNVLNGSIVFSIDQTANQLVITAKYNGGLTKTARINLT